MHALTYRIEWHITAESWGKVLADRKRHPPGSRWDRMHGPFLNGLFCPVQFRYGHDVLYPLVVLDRARQRIAASRAARAERTGRLPPPPDRMWNLGFHHSALGVATRTARLLDERDFASAPAGTSAEIWESDTDIKVYLLKRGGAVFMSSNYLQDEPDFADYELVVPELAFIDGSRDAISTLVTEIASRAPSILEWHSLVPLRAYLREEDRP